MNINRTLNRFLAAILVVVFHFVVGQFIPRSSLMYLVSLYIYVLTMIYIVGLPVDEKGQIQEDQMDVRPDIGIGKPR